AKAVELEPDYFEARTSLATALAQQGENTEAARHFEEAIKVRPSDANLHYNLATVLKALGRNEETLEHYLQASRLDPNDAEAPDQAGSLLAAQGRLAEAQTNFEEVIRRRPSPDAYYRLALVSVMQGHASEAIVQYRKALELKPDWPIALNDLAWLLAT